jgi:mono/diheme cytochrome c family protein
MRADRRPFRVLRALPLLLLGACSWFTDFRDQPKYEPWETANDSTPFRANPQFSVPMSGMPAPGLLVSYRPLIPVIDSVAMLVGANPMAADARSLENGRKSYQINCAVCHGAAGRGDGPATTYGVIPMPLVGPTTRALSDGQIFGIIRNGRGNMPTYNRIPDMERWDIINYLRGLQGQHPVVTAPAGVPGETGATLPSATDMAPTRPAPYYNRIGSQAGIPLGRHAAAPAAAGVPTDSAAMTVPAAGQDTAAPRPAPAAAPTDTTTRGSQP